MINVHRAAGSAFFKPRFRPSLERADDTSESFVGEEDFRLAHCTDLQQSYLSEIEHAKRNVSVDNVQRIAMALNATPAELQTPAA